MALNWNFNEKVGEMTLTMDTANGTETATYSLYEGNAYLIMLYEYEEHGKNYYTLYSFWADEEHMKNMLGLNPKKGYAKNEYVDEYQKVTGFKFNKAKCHHLNKIIPALVKAFDAITIEIY